MSDKERLFIEKYEDKEYKFTKSELRDMAVRELYEVVDEVEGDDHRWQREKQTVFKVGDRYFAINWMQALTECQEHDFWEQPYEVEKHEKTVVVTEWKAKER